MDPRLRRAFDNLGDAAVPYVVLRGYDPLDELASSVDVDVFVPQRAMIAAEAALSAAGWARRASQTGRHPHCFFDAWDGAAGVVRSIDVVSELCYGDSLRVVRGSDAVAARGVVLEGVRRPAAWDALVMLTLHILLDKQGMSAQNHHRLARAAARAAAEPSGRPLAAETFGGDALALVDEVAQRQPEPGSSLAELSARAARLHRLRARPVLARMTRLRARWRQFWRPTARVAILGIDGTGKSTLIESLTRAPSTLRIWHGYLGHNAFRTPLAKWLERQLAPYARPDHRGSQLWHRILANLRTLWWPLELAARMVVAEHRSELVLYDRFPIGQDLGSPTTRWGRLMLGYVRLSHAVLPRPDLVILLDGDDRVVWERKQESPFEVHQAVQARYRATVRAFRGESVFVRTDTSREESLDALRAAIAASPTIRRKLYVR